MNKIKKTIGVFALASSALAIASCGEKGPTRKEVEKFTITVTCQESDGEITFLESLAEGYMKLNPDRNVIVKNFGGSTFDNYMKSHSFDKQNLGDIIWMPDDYFASFAIGENFVDLRPYYEASSETSYDKYYQSMLHAANYYGEYKPYSVDPSPEAGIYFAPRDYNKPVIVCNTDLFNSAGIALPEVNEGWTLQEFTEFCQTVANTIKTSKHPLVNGAEAIYFNLGWEPIYTTFMNAYGADPVVDSTGHFNLHSEKNCEFLDYMYNNFAKYEKLMCYREESFNDGTCFMRMEVRSAIIENIAKVKDPDTGEAYIDFLPMPSDATTHSIGAGCSGYGIIANQAKNVQVCNGEEKTVEELAWDFIKYTISTQGQNDAGKSGGSVPVLKELENSGAWRQFHPEFNHDAFISGNELRLTTFNIFNPSSSCRTSLRASISSIFSKTMDKSLGSAEQRNNWMPGIRDQFDSLGQRFVRK